MPDFINSHCSEETPGFVCHIVLCELSWILESNYQQSKETIIHVVEELLQISQLEIMNPETVWRALNDFKTSNAAFVDHLIAGSNLFVFISRVLAIFVLVLFLLCSDPVGLYFGCLHLALQVFLPVSDHAIGLWHRGSGETSPLNILE